VPLLNLDDLFLELFLNIAEISGSIPLDEFFDLGQPLRHTAAISRFHLTLPLEACTHATNR
jgi:hypothetical protein